MKRGLMCAAAVVAAAGVAEAASGGNIPGSSFIQEWVDFFSGPVVSWAARVALVSLCLSLAFSRGESGILMRAFQVVLGLFLAANVVTYFLPSMGIAEGALL